VKKFRASHAVLAGFSGIRTGFRINMSEQREIGGPVLKCRVIQTYNLERHVFISNAYAQSIPGLDSNLTSFLPIILMFVVLYFLMIRPQMKRQKEQRAMMDALAKGDEVVTAGGILGKITKVGDAYVTLELADGVEVPVQKVAIATLLPKGTIKSL
jgi:preprotein translocase subunit YajC